MSDIGTYRLLSNSPSFRRPQTLNRVYKCKSLNIPSNESNNQHLTRKPSFRQKLFSIFKNSSKLPQQISPSSDSYAIDDNNKSPVNIDNIHVARSKSLCLTSKRNSQKLKQTDTADSHIKQLDSGDLMLIDRFNIHPINAQILRYITDTQCSNVKLPSSWINKMGCQLSNNVVKPFISIVPGLMGIENHGNTCYVNVIIQCLSHIDNVAEYFSTKDYLMEVNVDSSTSATKESASGFDVMVGFAYLLQSLWQTTYQGKISMKFCQLLTMHKSEFSIDSQQDAHELLLFILNLLHDNLMEKQRRTCNVENIQLPTLPQLDEEFLDETSFIYRKFRGWLSNEIVCPDCNYSRKTLDQILSLNLQIPKRSLDNETSVFYMVVINPNQVPEKHAFEIDNFTTVGLIRELIADRLFCNRTDVVVTELTGEGFGRLYSDNETIVSIVKRNVDFTLYGFDNHGNGLYATCIPNQVVDVDALQIETSLENDTANYPRKFKEFPVNQPFIRILVVHAEKSKDSEVNRLLRNETEDSLSPIDTTTTFHNQNQLLRFTNIMTVQAARKTNLSLLRHSLGEQLFKHFSLRNITKLPRPQFIIGESHLISEKEIFPLTHESVNKDLVHSMEFCGEDSAHIRLVVVWPYGTTDRLKYHSRRVRDGVHSSRHFSLNPQKIYNHSSVKELKSKFELENSEEIIQKKSQNKIDITDCLKEFFSFDTLSITESWKCPNCQTSQPARTEIRMQEAPETLILMLKRFEKQQDHSLKNVIDKRVSSRNEQVRAQLSSHTPSERSRDCLNKLEGLIDYPLTNLDLKPYMESVSDGESYLYDLVGVVNHRGSLFNGHYVAICYNSVDDSWRLYDDDRVSEIQKSEVVQPDAYILFYKRQQTQSCTNSNLHWSYRRLSFPDKIHRNHSPSPTSIYSKQSKYSDKESIKTLDTYSNLPLSITNNHSSKHSLKSRESPDLFEQCIKSPKIALSDISLFSANNDDQLQSDESSRMNYLSKIPSEIIDVDSISLDSSIIIDIEHLKTTSSNDSCTKSLNEDSGTALSQDFSCPIERNKLTSSLDNNSKDECYNSFSTSPTTSSQTTSDTY